MDWHQRYRGIAHRRRACREVTARTQPRTFPVRSRSSAAISRIEWSRDPRPRSRQFRGLRQVTSRRNAQFRSGLHAKADKPFTGPKKSKTPGAFRLRGFPVKTLAVTYSGMPEGHTTIGAERFHFRVRNGIGWFPLAIAARETGRGSRSRCCHRPLAPPIRRVSFPTLVAFELNGSLHFASSSRGQTA